MPIILDGELELITEIDGDFEFNSVEDGEGGVYIEVSAQSYDNYDGPYTIIPATESQVLETQNKVMSDDVTVTSIPYYNVSNPAGGKTVYIASEVEIGGTNGS